MEDSFGRPPLVYAARRSWHCSELLLQAGADVHKKDGFKGTLLHHATFRASSGDIRVVKCIVQKGVDIDARDGFEQTALLKTNKVEIAEYLIQEGANPRFCDHTGNSALTYVIMLNSHGLIHLFLKNGYDHMDIIKNYGTMLHLAAEFGDSRTIQLFACHNLRKRNVSVENSNGFTPNQLVLQRNDVDTNWREAFWTLQKRLDENQPFILEHFSAGTLTMSHNNSYEVESLESEEEESEGEFMDALDYQL